MTYGFKVRKRSGRIRSRPENIQKQREDAARINETIAYDTRQGVFLNRHQKRRTEKILKRKPETLSPK